MKTFFNVRYSSGRETVDELSLSDFNSHGEYRAEVRRMVAEYHLAGIPVYTSSRACSGWNN